MEKEIGDVDMGDVEDVEEVKEVENENKRDVLKQFEHNRVASTDDRGFASDKKSWGNEAPFKKSMAEINQQA